ncbi:hypothetical protein [Bradyrhizobium sp. 1(2017)]|uniref:hypothetical protein n=1 Tax=Bradyrhizobium sp. 1(2017) TaxID=1404888 RepID=UPI00140EC364|nr:hypothetical protein [Bradyrhizobium sp. 1(2017)]QIO34344.1 hypothetical protein HAP40_22370 [Bradyrhizobium sp. 1(2017)]
MQSPLDDAGPTQERLAKAGEFFNVAGRSRSSRRITMMDDPLGRSLMRRIISPLEYSSLRRYALHWAAAGLQGPLNSVDLNRIYAFDPGAMSGLAKTEAQLHHKQTYYGAKQAIGFRPSFVADQVACFGRGLQETGESLGMRSPYRARQKAAELLSDAGHRLCAFFDALR